MSGIYIHVPYCRQACTYCDFHFSTSLRTRDRMLQAMSAELLLRASALSKSTATVYFGGGTPSILEPQEIAQLLESIASLTNLSADAEITLEANPDDITSAKLHEWRSAGINRLTIGLQSFNDDELRWMNRAHSAAQSVSCVKKAQDAGFDNMTIDLIYGSRFQNMQTWEQTLLKAVGLGVPHISAYNLTIEKGTALGHAFNKGREPAIEDDLSSTQFMMMSEVLQQAGFLHYEVSNFAKPGHLARHNSNYWLQKPYVGIGPSAHSYNGKERRWNVRNNETYIKGVSGNLPYYETEVLSEKDLFNEYVMTRLRTIWGCDLREMNELFGAGRTAKFAEAARLCDGVTENNGLFTLTTAGKLRADGIAASLFA